ncbi:MAG TPA: MIP/aquaporin family protein [Ktedonobacterales bacterium]
MQGSLLNIDRVRANRFLGSIWGELIAEFLGTMVLILFGDGAVAIALGAGTGFNNPLFNNWMVISLGWGLGVMLGVYVAGAVTGAHINPAVTLAFALRRKFPWAKVVPYWIAQVLGAYAGAAMVYFNYNWFISNYEAANHIIRGVTANNAAILSAKILYTFPNSLQIPGNPPATVSNLAGFADQVLGTALLVGLIFAVVDLLNQPVQSNLAPFIIGLIVVAIGLSFGLNAGYAINPARDFGPRLFAFTVGYGLLAIPGPGGYMWVPIVGPLVGGVIGALVYDLGIHSVLVARHEQAASALEERGRTVREQPGAAGPEMEERGRTTREV